MVEDYDHHVNHSASRHQAHAEEVAVPTEYLQDDLDTLIQLPANFRAGKAARFIAAQPRRVLNAIAVASAVMTLWVARPLAKKNDVDEAPSSFCFYDSMEPDLQDIILMH